MGIKICCNNLAQAIEDELFNEKNGKLYIQKMRSADDGDGRIDIWPEYEIEIKYCPFCREPINNEARQNTKNIEALLNLKPESKYQFYLYCRQLLKKTKQEIDPNINGLNLDNPKQRQEAWEKVVKKFGGKV